VPCFSDSDLLGSCFDILFRGSLCTLWFDVEGNHVVSSRLFSRGCFREVVFEVVFSRLFVRFESYILVSQSLPGMKNFKLQVFCYLQQ